MSGKRPLLREARALQRYVCGRGAPRFALRRWLRLLGPNGRPLTVPGWLWRWPALLAGCEPLPVLPRSPLARELERRLFLAAQVTEATPWGARQAAAAARGGWGSLCMGIAGFGLLEAAVLPVRLVCHVLAWRPASVDRGQP